MLRKFLFPCALLQRALFAAQDTRLSRLHIRSAGLGPEVAAGGDWSTG